MALVLVATAGSVSANTYCTLAEATSYFEKRLHKAAWAAAGGSDKNAALAWATRLLDESVKWNGYKTYDDQALQWPRSAVYDIEGDAVDDDSIPQFLKDATAEFAMHLVLEDRTLETNRDLKGLRRVTVDVIDIVVDTRSMNTHKPVMPPSVWSIVKFYGTLYSQKKTLVRM